MQHWKIVLGFSVVFSLVLFSCTTVPREYSIADELPVIYPDYTFVVLPPNIAPVNFKIKNEGAHFRVSIRNSQGDEIVLACSKAKVILPVKKWKKLLKKDPGGTLTFSIFRKSAGGKWEKLKDFTNTIAPEKIDPYIVYRKIPPANIQWRSMGIYQRSLENFEESPVMVNKLTGNNCMNCHSFNQGDPGSFLFHMRGPIGGTFISTQKEIQFVNTKSEHARAAGAYPSWHPGGELIAFSANLIQQGFHSQIGKISTVIDKYSDILLYDIRSQSISRPGILATEALENTPSWSMDGKKLFYISAEKNTDSLPLEKIRYSLMSIDFDFNQRSFGEKDTLLSALQFGKSISFPRPSPDGNLIAFVGLDYGYFSIYSPEADIYLYNLKSGETTKPAINSSLTESYPSWSGNGSWLMFVSKRDDGVFSQVWFSFVDSLGNAGKPFVLPQKDPGFYQQYELNFNRPEFTRGEILLHPRKIYNIVKGGAKPAGFNKAASVSVSSGATVPASKEEVFYHHN